MQSQFLPETDAATLEHFAVGGQLAIKSVFDELVRDRALITLYSARNHDDFVVSHILDWDAGGVVFDFTTDQSRQRALTAGGMVTVVAFLERVKIQFVCRELAIVERDGLPALRCALPREVFRIQRRDAFRVRPPYRRPVECIVRTIEGIEHVYRVLDVSATGVSVSLPSGEPTPPIGEHWRHCRLEIPSYPAIPCDLIVRSTGAGLGGEAGSTRVGCAFWEPDTQTQRAVQLYVMDIERTRLR